MGVKWSIYLASLCQFLFDELGQSKKIEFDKAEKYISIYNLVTKLAVLKARERLHI